VPRLLLIDDDPNVLDMTAMLLEDAGHDVETAANGRDGLNAHAAAPFDAIVSDINMPVLDGFSLCRELRDAGDATPLILLTARDSEIDEALGLDLGADDYLIKPFRSRTLVARVRAVLRRGRVAEPEPELLERDGVRLDRERLAVHFLGQPIQATVTEFRLLITLMEQPGIVMDRERLLVGARQDDSVVAPRIIDTYVRRLRRKFGEVDDQFDAIETVIGAGYRWRE